LHEESVSLLELMSLPDTVDVQIVVSDGLNAQAISDDGQLLPFLRELRNSLERMRFNPAKENLVVTSGRVRTGYRIGEKLFGNRDGKHSIVHLIGERPGTGHHTFSAYLTLADQELWSQADAVDHNITKVVSGIAKTALDPIEAAETVSRLLAEMRRDS
jgi:ethanolamine ammonia-lyase large subunit